MAARENQGYMIAVIVLVLLLLISGVVAFLGLQNANELRDELKAEKDKATTERKAAEAYQAQSQILQAFVGQRPVADIEANYNALQNMTGVDEALKKETSELRNEYDRDMALYVSSGAKDDTKNYQTLINQVVRSMGVLHTQKSVAEAERDRIKRDTQEQIEAKNAELAKLQETLADTNEQLKKEQEAHKQTTTTFQLKLDDIIAINENLNRRAEEEKSALRKIISNKDGEIGELAQTNSALKTRLNHLTRENFDLADGTILGVSSQVGMVVVNLGSADGLRPNTTFAVYDRDTTNFEKGQHKGMIEITRIVDGHSAEGQITLENPTDNPIVTGDKVLTATWDPGHRVPIAISGDFDIDGDGISDLLRVVRDIENNSGQVVAYVDEDGQIVGELDATTRFYVRGDPPKDHTAANYGAVTSSMKKLDQQATDFAVQQIDVKRLYEFMGRRPRAFIERLDSRVGEAERNEGIFERRSPADALRGRQ